MTTKNFDETKNSLNKYIYYTCDKQVLWESAGAFFSARQLSDFTRQLARFTRSWSSGKMLAFQPRGFVFEPVGMRYFFTSILRQKVLTFFGTMRLFGFVRLFFGFVRVFRNFLNVPKESSFQFFDILQQNECYKILKGPFFTFFGTMRLSGNFKKIRKVFSQFLVLKDRF